MDEEGVIANEGYCSDDCPMKKDSLWKPDDTISVTTHFENDVDIRYMMNEEDEVIQPVYLDIVRVNSSGPAAELYPDSLGDYYLLPPDITLNDLPVYKHSVRDDRFIVNILFEFGDVSEHFMLVTREISNSGLREFSSVRKYGQTIEDLDWKYNIFPHCRTL